MLRKLVWISLLAAALPALAESLNHSTGTRGVLMIDKVGGHVRFFDPATLTERAGIEVAKNPHDFALSADHRFAYVPIYGSGVYNRNPDPGHEIYVFDLEAQALARVIDVAPYRSPHGIQIDSRGLLYVTAELDRKVLVVDPAASRVIDTIDHDGAGHWLAVLPDGSKAYVANKDDQPHVSVIDLAARKQIGRVPMPNGTQGIAASPDGTRVIAMDFTEPVIAVIDTATDAVIDRITLEGATGGAYKAYYSPDGKWLLTMSGSVVGIFAAEDLRAPQRVVTVGAFPMGIAFAPDGGTALVANHGEGTVAVVDLASARVTRTFPAGAGVETLSYY